ncbi:MAG: hypothetical protein KKE57_10870 [Proteobacteria bacterium]|nr:hypothetical protein [Pseudomonadota bacterium]
MNAAEKRSESRVTTDQYYSVEFSTKGIEFTYQFKIWNVSSKGMCVLVKEDSDILSHLKVGDVIDMKYYQDDSFRPVEYLKTEIRHITKDDTGRFRDNYLVGLAICA